MSGLDGTYLGDGVYATDDGYQVRLATQRGRQEVDGVDVVYLEPSVLAALAEYAREKGIAPPKVKAKP